MYRFLLAFAVLFFWTATATADALPSWTNGAAKARIVAFVEAVTDSDAEKFVPVAERIAVFDNDGTLWSEQPMYFQLIFAMDRVAELAQADPSILTSDTLRAAANGDAAGVLANGEEGLIEVLGVSHAGMSVEQFKAVVAEWLDNTRHPTTGMRYDRMVYQPMLELLSYLRDNDFKTYIVSGGGVDFMRVFAGEAYGIPSEQVIGSLANATYGEVDGALSVIKEPGLAFIDDKEGKPIAIERVIGKRPIFIGGNSDGDFAMLEWSTAQDGPSLGIIVHHTDAEREWAYDRDSHIGRLVRGLDEGPARGWVIVDMAEEWTTIYPGTP